MKYKMLILITLILSCKMSISLNHKMNKEIMDKYNSNFIIKYIDSNNAVYFLNLIKEGKISSMDYLTLDTESLLSDENINVDFKEFVNTPLELKISVLGYAILRGKIEVVKCLLDQGFSITSNKAFNIGNLEYIHFISLAAINRDLELIELIIEKKPELLSTFNNYFLYEIIKFSKSEKGLVKILDNLPKVFKSQKVEYSLPLGISIMSLEVAYRKSFLYTQKFLLSSKN